MCGAYERGRGRSAAELQTWARVLARYSPSRRPLTVLDLGSGTGALTVQLAELFKGNVYGVEPSAGMRAVATRTHAHQRVAYLGGRAEAIPLTDGACDIVTMFLSLHHISDRDAAAREIARVLSARGRVFVNSGFSGELVDQEWYKYFPRAREIEDQMFPSRSEVLVAFARFGLTMVDMVLVRWEAAGCLADYHDRLRYRTISTFEQLDEEEISGGFAAMREAVARDDARRPVMQGGKLLVLTVAGHGPEPG